MRQFLDENIQASSQYERKPKIFTGLFMVIQTLMINSLLAMPKKVMELMASLELLPELNFRLLLIFVINNVWEKYLKIQHLNRAHISHAQLITCITPVFPPIFIRSIVSS